MIQLDARSDGQAPLGSSLTMMAAVFITTLLTSASAQGQTMLTQAQIKQGYMEQAALAQFHRWYQIYENNAVPIESSLDILMPDVKIKSSLGEGVGHQAYKQRIAELPKTWKNAHRVKDTKIDVAADGQVQLIANIEYLNQGSAADGSVRAANLKYTTQLKPTDSVLPRFTALAIEQVSASDTKTFADAYPENRLKSLTHYWLALVEDPKRRLEPFQEILAKDFKLDFSSGAITDFAGFEKWFRGPGSAVAASTHQMSNFSYQRTGDNRFNVKVDFDWQGILPDGREMVAKTRHSWTVEDNATERFARIKTAQVEVLKPFTPRTN